MKRVFSCLFIFLMVIAPVLSIAAQASDPDATKVKKSHSPKLKQVHVKHRSGKSKKSRVKSKDMTPVPQENVTDQVEVSQQSDKLAANHK